MGSLKNLKYLLILLLVLIPIGLVIGLHLMGFDVYLSIKSVIGASLVLFAFRLAMASPNKE